MNHAALATRDLVSQREFPTMVFPTRVDLRLTLFSLLTALLATPASAQSTINVPANAPTIQAGINAASNGDTVLVSPGTYFEY